MTLSQISLTRAKHEDGAKRAFTDKKPFLSLNCREWEEGGLNRLRESSAERKIEENLSKEEKDPNF